MSFRVFYLTAFYTAHRARDKAAIRCRFSHKLSTTGRCVFVERAGDAKTDVKFEGKRERKFSMSPGNLHGYWPPGKRQEDFEG